MLCYAQVGIRIADLDFKEMADPINLLEVDFYTSTMKDVYPKNSYLPRYFSKACPLIVSDLSLFVVDSLLLMVGYVWTSRKFSATVKHSGILHAVVCYFDLFVDKERKHVVSTHPSRTDRNRDMAWGQQIQVRNAIID